VPSLAPTPSLGDGGVLAAGGAMVEGALLTGSSGFAGCAAELVAAGADG
jgi:hypothetical protein